MIEAAGFKKLKLRGGYGTIGWQRPQGAEQGEDRQNAQAMAGARGLPSGEQFAAYLIYPLDKHFAPDNFIAPDTLKP